MTVSPEYLRGYRAGQRTVSAGMKTPTRSTTPEHKTLDAAVEKVGVDFPSLGAVVREAWTSAA